MDAPFFPNRAIYFICSMDSTATHSYLTCFSCFATRWGHVKHVECTLSLMLYTQNFMWTPSLVDMNWILCFIAEPLLSPLHFTAKFMSNSFELYWRGWIYVICLFPLFYMSYMIVSDILYNLNLLNGNIKEHVVRY